MSAQYNFRLYISGASELSIEAVKNVKRLCESTCGDQFNLEIIDVHQQSALAEKDRIIATPTLIKNTPLPARRVVGAMKDSASLRAELNL